MPDLTVVQSTVTLAAPGGGEPLNFGVPTQVDATDPYISSLLDAGFLRVVTDEPVAVSLPSLPDMSWTRPDIVAVAESTYGITVSESMTKQELIDAITEAATEQAGAPKA